MWVVWKEHYNTWINMLRREQTHMGISLWKTGIKDRQEFAQGEPQVTEEQGSNKFLSFCFFNRTTLPLPVSPPGYRKRAGDSVS